MATEYRQFLLGEEFADLLTDPASVAVAEPKVDRNALCEKLITNLRAQHGLYVDYLEQAKRQRMALVNRRLAENQNVNHEVDKLINSLAGLEEQRLEITAALLGRKSGDASTPAKVDSIYELVRADLAAELKQCRNDLVDTVAELKQVLATNQALVENGSKIIHTTIGILTSVVGRGKAERMNTYTAKGNVNVGKVQIRNLVNRSV